MKYSQIGMGTKVELELLDGNGDRTVTGLVSQYEAYDEESNIMEIHAPFSQRKIYAVQPNTMVNVIFARDNDIYMFRAEVVDRKNLNPIPMLFVKPVSPIEKIERRSFFRMDCSLPVQYRVIEQDIKDDKEKHFKKCYTKDISGGGVCIVTDTEHAAGTDIEAYMELGKTIAFTGTVIRSIRVQEKGKILYETGVVYKHIENRDREKIISFVFETQRERLRQGLMRE